jgi:hypothetical protein
LGDSVPVPVVAVTLGSIEDGELLVKGLMGLAVTVHTTVEFDGHGKGGIEVAWLAVSDEEFRVTENDSDDSVRVVVASDILVRTVLVTAAVVTVSATSSGKPDCVVLASAEVFETL